MMKLKIIGAFLGMLVGAFSRFYVTTAQGAELYDAYAARGGRVVHMIMSDNATPADLSDDWVVDWEYLD